MNVAIKKLHAHTSKKESEQAKLLLQNEFKTLSSCRHENIVQMFNICSDPPMLILASEKELRDLFDNEPICQTKNDSSCMWHMQWNGNCKS